MKDPTAPPHHTTRATRRVATIVAAAALLLTGCDPADTTPAADYCAGWGPLSGCNPADDSTAWVVDGIGYHGPRGAGQYYAECTPAEHLTADPDAPRYGPWKDIAIAADDGTLEAGDPCPTGRVIDQGDGS